MFRRLNWLTFFLIGLCLCAASPVTAGAESPDSSAPRRDADIEKLQRQVDRLETELKQLKQAQPTNERTVVEPAPVKSPIGESVRSEGSQPSLDQLAKEFRGEFDFLHDRVGVLHQILDRRVGMSMYLTTEFEAFQHGEAEFAGAKMELFPSIKLTDRIRAFGEFEFNSTIDSGAANPNERGKVELDQAWIEYSVNEQLKPRVGVVLVPFGRYNLEAFDPVQEFTSRPIFAKKVIPTTWSEVSVGFTGRANLGSGMGDGWFRT
ncbi:MAG: hypothetical protein SGJ26_11500 [Nitrospirota bacterium]|nr:hypothetical protein [Nitrospirota bacterium]